MINNAHEDICWKYLRHLTIAHAIPRINECLVLKKFDLKSPILDLGCGEGVFAKLFFENKKIDVGLDIDPKAAKLAQNCGVYTKVVVAKAGNLPFPDNSFNTVFSNSVLEHIEDLDEVFSEVYRVLKKKGKFIFLVPDRTASDYFFYAEIFKKIGLKNLAKRYIKLKNSMYQYKHLEDKTFWNDLSKRNRFKISNVYGLISPETVRVIDLFSPSALPDYILRKFSKRSFVFRPEIIAKILTPFVVKYCRPLKDEKPTAWCFELEKL